MKKMKLPEFSQIFISEILNVFVKALRRLTDSPQATVFHQIFMIRSYFPCCRDPVQTELHVPCRSCLQNTAGQSPHPL